MTDTKQTTKVNTSWISNRTVKRIKGEGKKSGIGSCSIILLNMLLLFPLSLYPQDSLRNVPNPDPKFELETFNVADGFEANLFAEEPMLVKPIQMNWDEKGRLWVVGSKNYPQLKPGEVPNDKIYVLEDTTGDGKADVSTIFAEGLHIPTGILPGDGGAYVANATEILHLKDTNGDGKADKRRIVLSGFGTGDTHHLIHTFRWGPAGRFYINQSIYIYSHIETPYGVKELKGGGVWRYQPETMELGIYSRGLVNPWGLLFNKWGQSFLTDGAGHEGINYAFPGATFVSAPGAERILQGLNPGQPKHSGLAIISGRHLPDSLRGSLITNDYRANRINRFVLKKQGSGYESTQVEDLLWSNNVAFRPVDVSIGPDGAIYVADWYNPIIQHGEVDFRDPRRDHQHGRIWRITAKDRPLVKKPQLSGASTTELLNALKMPEKWTRSQAKRLLKERGAEAIAPDLGSWISNLDSTDSDYAHNLLEGLWVFQSVDTVNEALLKTVLNSTNSLVRAAAVRVLNYWYGKINNAPDLLEAAVVDEDPSVRLEAVIALRNENTAKAASTALSVLKYPMDNFLDFALWQTVRKLQPYWLDKVKNNLDFFDNPKITAYALKSVNDSSAVKYLMRLYQQGKVPEEYNQDVFNSVAARGSVQDLNIIWDLALSDEKIHKNRRAAYLTTLEEAARQQDKRPTNGLDRIIKYVDVDNDQVAQSAIKLIGYWDLKKLRKKLASFVQDERISQAALEALVLMDDKESKRLLIEMTGPDHPPELRMKVTTSLVSLDLGKAASIAAKILKEAESQIDVTKLFTAFLSRTDGTQALADELSDQNIPKEFASVGLKTMQRQVPVNKKEDSGVKALRESLEASGGELPPEHMPQDLNSQQVHRLELDIKAGADPSHGEHIFRDLACMSCHALGGAGGRLGPDLSSLGANAPTDYIIHKLLEPSANIKDGYELNRIVKNDGSIVTGYHERETDTEIVLRDVSGQEISVPVNQIKSHEIVPGSLMPPGLTSSLEREEFIDLVGFLSKVGEPGEFRIPNTRLVRRWQTLADSENIVEQIRKKGLDVIIKEGVEMHWQPAYSKASGDLPLGEIAAIELKQNKKYSLVRFDVEVLSAGNVALSFNSTKGMSIWVGQESIDITDDGILTDLSKGIHSFTLAIDRNIRKKGALRIELQEAEKTSAQSRLIMQK